VVSTLSGIEEMAYETLKEPRGILVTWRGAASAAEMIQMQEGAHAHAAFDTFRYSIHDFSRCDSFSWTPGDIEYSAAIDRAASQSNPNINIAIVGAKADVMEGAKAYIQTTFSPFPIRFFASLAEARSWVNTA